MSASPLRSPSLHRCRRLKVFVLQHLKCDFLCENAHKNGEILMLQIICCCITHNHNTTVLTQVWL